METRTFGIITAVSMALTVTAAALSIIGIAITGFYPGIIVLILVAMIPVASRSYARKRKGESDDLQSKYLTPLAIVNLLAILVVVWMTFVILVDRVFARILS